MFRLRGVLQRVAVFDNARDAARSGTEYGRICVSKVGVETSLAYMLVH